MKIVTFLSVSKGKYRVGFKGALRLDFKEKLKISPVFLFPVK